MGPFAAFSVSFSSRVVQMILRFSYTLTHRLDLCCKHQFSGGFFAERASAVFQTTDVLFVVEFNGKRCISISKTESEPVGKQRVHLFDQSFVCISREDI